MITNGSTEPNPFADLAAYVELPQVAGLWQAPDGSRLVVGAARPDHTGKRYTKALWQVDPTAAAPARRLTRSTPGEAAAAFTPAGDLLFVSARPEPDAEAPEKPVSALWLQPAAGGDARVIAAPPGGVYGVRVSPTGTVVFGSALLPSAADLDADAELREKRRTAAVSAILHEQAPVRFWDHDLGPDHARLLTAELTEAVTAGEARLELRDLTGPVGLALHDDCTWELTPDGRTVVAMWATGEPGGAQRFSIAAIDVASGERRVLADHPDREYYAPEISPDGTRVAVAVERRLTPEEPHATWLAVIDLASGELTDLTRDWDRWPAAMRWTPDGAELIVAADHQGRAPLWRVDVATGEPTRLTPDDGAYTDLRISPDGRWVYALRAAIDSAPRPVRVSLRGVVAVQALPGPAEALDKSVTMPGRLTEVTATAEDGTPLRAWLVLPPEASEDHPVPLLLQVHGGPVMSLNSWSWRWNPWILAAHGYAVLMPDYALSTGYGVDFVRRGWGQWGGTPFTDLMTITDAALERPDLDAGRTAAIGGSFGGYMANWIAGHTDRFAAIVTHASVWNLPQSISNGDVPFYFRREMTPEQAVEYSPHRFVDAISTPMLVIHCDRDYRVPIAEGMQLWTDLSTRSKAENGSGPHKFLYFPDENHWILTPNHARIWYETVLAFLDQHVNGADWKRPELLG
ncbi:MAG TPA: prolyl oligopeptidase family serine peptidase [Pseudonocardiaceae bacterium]|nr:prolyl oligopeptidase family serine peptidase [Pseudonocardiaceae bacterium]